MLCASKDELFEPTALASTNEIDGSLVQKKKLMFFFCEVFPRFASCQDPSAYAKLLLVIVGVNIEKVSKVELLFIGRLAGVQGYLIVLNPHVDFWDRVKCFDFVF